MKLLSFIDLFYITKPNLIDRKKIIPIASMLHLSKYREFKK